MEKEEKLCLPARLLLFVSKWRSWLQDRVNIRFNLFFQGWKEVIACKIANFVALPPKVFGRCLKVVPSNRNQKSITWTIFTVICLLIVNYSLTFPKSGLKICNSDFSLTRNFWYQLLHLVTKESNQKSNGHNYTYFANYGFFFRSNHVRPKKV